MPIVDDALVGIGRVIGKPPGWERIVRALAPPSRFVGGAPRQTAMSDGYMFPIDPGTIIGWNIFFFGSYEPEVRAQIRRWLSPGACAVDVGANVGWHALLMATIVGPAGRVYAFEPNDSTRARLRGAIEANGLDQITVDPRALSDRIGTTGFEAPQAGDVWDGTGRMTGAPANSGSGTSVECVTLDAFVAEHGIDRLDLIKIDVEGWEQTVLRGGRQTLERLAPSILFEYDPAYVTRCGGSGAGLTALFTDAGYTLFRLDRDRAPFAVPALGDVGANFLAVPRRRGERRVRSLAIVASHPVQYQVPWYRALATMVELKVFFAHRITAVQQASAGFDVPFEWNVPLFDGYQFEWLTNVAADPAVDRFRGCDTPQIADRLARGRFDAVVVNGWNLLSYWQAIRAARRIGLPVMVRGDSQLVTERGALRRAVKRLVYPRLLRSFDAMLTVGARNEAYYRHYGVSSDRLFPSPHCVDNDFFARTADEARRRPDGLRRQTGVADDAIVFLFVGKLIAKKRPLDFLAALEQARRTRQDVRGIIVGDGPLRAEVDAYCARHDTGCVTIGFLNQLQIAGAYAVADALVLASDGGETWGLVVNEAMACGVPAIVSDAAGCAPDLVDEGRTGFAFPCGDVQALTDRMLRLAASGAEGRAALGRCARQRISAFSPHVAAAGVVNAMNALTRETERMATERPDPQDPHHVDAAS